MREGDKKQHSTIAAEIAAFAVSALVLAAALILVALIPQESIYDNMLSSAEYLRDGELFGDAIDGINGSRIDRYADSILLGIAWQYDKSHPFISVMRSAFYSTPLKNENYNLYDAVAGGLGANEQYIRYWHGSIAVVRPLLLIFDLKGIYIFNSVILAGLLIVFGIITIRDRAYVPFAAMLCGLLFTQAVFVPLSLEYTWTFMLMFIFSISAYKLARAEKRKSYGCLFVISGVATAYFDFLTTETICLTIPLLLILWVEGRAADKKVLWRTAVKAALCWGAAFVGMWVLKWGLASLILKENVMSYVTGHVQERLGGEIGLSLGSYLSSAVIRNVLCLFPAEYGNAGIIAAIMLVLGICYVLYVYRKDTVNKDKILLYGAIALVPYIRYLVLHNHAYLHYFFTYRAQMCMIMSVGLIIHETADIRLPGKRHKNKRLKR